MDRLQPLAFSMALFFVLPGVLGVIAGLLGFRSQHIFAGLLGISGGTLLLSYGGWLARQAGRHRFPNWIRDLHTMLRL